jgi:hypothetical protein
MAVTEAAEAEEAEAAVEQATSSMAEAERAPVVEEGNMAIAMAEETAEETSVI